MKTQNNNVFAGKVRADPGLIRRAIQFLSMTGEVLYHDSHSSTGAGTPSEQQQQQEQQQLEDRIWLDPQWLVNVMREFVRHDLAEHVALIGGGGGGGDAGSAAYTAKLIDEAGGAERLRDLGQHFLEMGELDRCLVPWLWRELKPRVDTPAEVDALLLLLEKKLNIITRVPHIHPPRWLLPMRLPVQRPDLSASAAHVRFGEFLTRAAGVESMEGLEDTPVATLSHAISFIKGVPGAPSAAALDIACEVAYRKADELLAAGPDPHELNRDEIASINMFTQDALYSQLNAAMRSSDRQLLRPYFGYVRLLQHALFKLPRDTSGSLFRGVRVSWMPLEEMQAQLEALISPATSTSAAKAIVITPEVWWGFSSTSTNLKAVQSFLVPKKEKANCICSRLFMRTQIMLLLGLFPTQSKESKSA